MAKTLADRRIEVDAVCGLALEWAEREPSIIAVALVGSWARGTATIDSDVDLVVLAEELDRFVEREDWVAEALGSRTALVRTHAWGVLTERRARLPSGLEVELGFAPPSWARTDPVDPGTARVVQDGCQVLVDPDRLLGRLLAAVQR